MRKGMAMSMIGYIIIAAVAIFFIALFAIKAVQFGTQPILPP